MTEDVTDTPGPITHYLRKYPNRRLYSVTERGYVTQGDIIQLLRKGHDVIIRAREKDKSGVSRDREDVTSTVLLSAIQENPALTEALNVAVDFKALIRNHA